MPSDGGRLIPGILKHLRELGVRRGDLLVMHSSFKSMGLVGYSPADVIGTLFEAIGPEGTLMAPTFTYSYSGVWGVTPFNPQTTPGWKNGVLTEALRLHPSALRSAHPTYSVAAAGRWGEKLTAGKADASALGVGSSYDEAHALGGRVLLLGVGNNRNSMLHFAEVAAGLPYNDIPFREFWGRTAVVERDGRAVHVPLVPEFPGCSLNFGVADAFLEHSGILRSGKVGAASCMLMDAREMVAAVIRQLKQQPDWLLCDSIGCEPCTLRRRRLAEAALG